MKSCTWIMCTLGCWLSVRMFPNLHFTRNYCYYPTSNETVTTPSQCIFNTPLHTNPGSPLFMWSHIKYLPTMCYASYKAVRVTQAHCGVLICREFLIMIFNCPFVRRWEGRGWGWGWSWRGETVCVFIFKCLAIIHPEWVSGTVGNNIFSNHTNINVHLPPRPYIFYIDILYSTHHITINIQCTDKFQFVQFQVIFQTKLELNILENIGRVIFQVKAVLARLMSKCLKMSYNLIPQDQYFHPSYCKIERSFSSVLCLSAQFNSFSVIVSTQKTNYGEAWPGAASAVDAVKDLVLVSFSAPPSLFIVHKMSSALSKLGVLIFDIDTLMSTQYFSSSY